mmetsp:Transcript_22974/g.34266  ORF Transcript_22974/g.34266 Transcript_22974/m.34266 type:complete len:87 (-) Transcript_22974:38-298(-)
MCCQDETCVFLGKYSKLGDGSVGFAVLDLALKTVQQVHIITRVVCFVMSHFDLIQHWKNESYAQVFIVFHFILTTQVYYCNMIVNL